MDPADELLQRRRNPPATNPKWQNRPTTEHQPAAAAQAARVVGAHMQRRRSGGMFPVPRVVGARPTTEHQPVAAAAQAVRVVGAHMQRRRSGGMFPGPRVVGAHHVQVPLRQQQQQQQLYDQLDGVALEDGVIYGIQNPDRNDDNNRRQPAAAAAAVCHPIVLANGNAVAQQVPPRGFVPPQQRQQQQQRRLPQQQHPHVVVAPPIQQQQVVIHGQNQQPALQRAPAPYDFVSRQVHHAAAPPADVPPRRACCYCQTELIIVKGSFGRNCSRCDRALHDPLLEALVGHYVCGSPECPALRNAEFAAQRHVCQDCFLEPPMDKKGQPLLSASRVFQVDSQCAGVISQMTAGLMVDVARCAEPDCVAHRAPLLWKSRGVMQCARCEKQLVHEDCQMVQRCKVCNENHTTLFLSGPRLGQRAGAVRRSRSRSPSLAEVKLEAGAYSSDDDITTCLDSL